MEQSSKMGRGTNIEYFTSTNELLERILAVDFHRDLPKEVSGTLTDVQKRIRWHRPLEQLPTHITDVLTYHRSFFPLYMIECLQMLASNKYMNMGYPMRVWKGSHHIYSCFVDLTLHGTTGFPFIPGDLVLLYVGTPGHDLVPQSVTPAVRETIRIDESEEDRPSVAVPEDHPIYEDTLKHAIGYVGAVSRHQCAVELLVRPPSFANMETFDIRSVERLEAIQQLIDQPPHSRPGTVGFERIDNSGEAWYVAKLCSFATSLREFRALCSMSSLPLVDKLLQVYEDPVTVQTEESDDKHKYLDGIDIPVKLRLILEASYNAAQLRSIRNTLKSDGITLIQGPPGTGKTTTIIGLISAILEHDSFPGDDIDTDKICDSDMDDYVARKPWLISSQYYGEPMDITFDELNETDVHMDDGVYRYDSYACMKPNQTSSSQTITVPTMRDSKRRILICAPSNAAIDEIVRRLVRPVTGGIFNAQGERYNPSVTRIGPNFHDDLTMYSLKNKVDRLGELKYGSFYSRSKGHLRHRLIRETLDESDIICSTLSACGSNELFAHRNMFDTLIIDEATQAVELSTLIALSLGCKRVILVGDPCQLSATVCSNVAVSLKYDRSLFQRLQMCGYPVNLLNIQYRMDPSISRFPSMYFYRNQLKDAPNVYHRQREDWREFPLLRPAVFYAIDSLQAKNETSYMNETEAELVCQLLELILEVLSAEPGFQLSSLEQRIAVITTYSAQVVLLKETIARRHPQLVVQSLEKDDGKVPGQHAPKLLIDVSSVDGFQGMEKEIVIFSAVRTSYVDGRSVTKKSLQQVTPSNVLTIDGEPHDPEKAAKFARVVDDYLKGVRSGDMAADIRDVVDVSFIADRRRINVAITRACRNLFIVGMYSLRIHYVFSGNPRFLLGHMHWQSLYRHYAQCGSIFLCKLGRSTLKRDYLKSWARQYLFKDEASQQLYYLISLQNALARFRANPSLSAFVENLMSANVAL
ncbi:putative helicase [Babesia sp. Xinjiang]|uniref:putative helicase n=1 Tax=Babesia sp. Xinjiang TaxID=462227 RepID=UPI000A2480F0|nr:putative helicase [Babesia sp. Xinjiang]ORM39892.1 putative helicase [Babesia sp. Xinjiang]